MSKDKTEREGQAGEEGGRNGWGEFEDSGLRCKEGNLA
jgi:hypothetical protein